MVDMVEDILGDWEPIEGPIQVDLELYVKQPKKTKLDAPKADIDNYCKSILDCMNKKLWVDDTQIVKIYAVKQWATKEEDGYFIIGVDNV